MPGKAKKSANLSDADVLTGMNSDLADVDLRKLLNIPEAWDSLPKERKQEILSKFEKEDIANHSTPSARPNIPKLNNSNDWRSALARFGEHLGAGHLEHDSISQALDAHLMRSNGEYEPAREGMFKSQYGMDPPAPRPAKTKSDEPADDDKAKKKPKLFYVDGTTAVPFTAGENDEIPMEDTTHLMSGALPDDSRNGGRTDSIAGIADAPVDNAIVAEAGGVDNDQAVTDVNTGAPEDASATSDAKTQN